MNYNKNNDLSARCLHELGNNEKNSQIIIKKYSFTHEQSRLARIGNFPLLIYYVLLVSIKFMFLNIYRYTYRIFGISIK